MPPFLELGIALFNGPMRNVWPLLVVPCVFCLIRDQFIREPAQNEQTSISHGILIILPGAVALLLAVYAIADFLIPGAQDHAGWYWRIAPFLGGSVLLYAGYRCAARLVLLRRLFRLGQEPPVRITLIAAELGVRVRWLGPAENASFVAGVLSPTIFVGGAVIDTLADAELRALLLHERAHLTSRDAAWLFVASCTQDAIVARSPRSFARFVAGRERLADKLAVRVCDPADLAAAVLRLRRASRSPGFAFQAADAATVQWRLRLLFASSDESAGESAAPIIAAATMGAIFLSWPALQLGLCELFCPSRW